MDIENKVRKVLVNLEYLKTFETENVTYDDNHYAQCRKDVIVMYPNEDSGPVDYYGLFKKITQSFIYIQNFEFTSSSTYFHSTDIQYIPISSKDDYFNLSTIHDLIFSYEFLLEVQSYISTLNGELTIFLDDIP